jgi:putative phosphonate catabolism associated alcohol dehydrogenase
MTRAILFHAAGEPLKERSVRAPELRCGEVLVRVTCCTLCRSDLHTHAGRRTEPTPAVLGHEIVGRVEALGPDAPRTDGTGAAVEIGARVTWAVGAGCGACFFCRDADLPQKCERLFKYGHARATDERPLAGGLAERVVLVPNTALFRVPDELPDAVAAQANCATATAAAVVRAAGSLEGRAVLVFGAGVLGLTACAMARGAGAAAVIVADPLPAGRDRALRFGATRAVDPAEAEAAVRAATDGRGADAVFELAGAARAVESALGLARVGGTVVLAGTVSPVGSVALDPERAVRRLLTIRGIHNYHPRDLAAALAFLAGPGRAYPWADLVVAEFPLERAEEAFAAAHAAPGVRVAVRP